MGSIDYSGDELDVFSLAENWKSYWSDEIKPYIGSNILEIGAGIGATGKALNYKNYERWLAVEPDGKLCEIIDRKLKNGELPSCLEIRNGTSDDLTSTELFDTALYIDVLEHIEDDRAELLKIQPYLVKGGKVIIVAPAHQMLYTEFDRKIGHFRRYNKKMLLSAIPDGYIVREMKYLDSVGMLASLANKLFIKSDTPTESQIQMWDKLMVKTSLVLDKLIGYKFGKTLVCVLELSDAQTL